MLEQREKRIEAISDVGSREGGLFDRARNPREWDSVLVDLTCITADADFAKTPKTH
jgi:hypothetical protein